MQSFLQEVAADLYRRYGEDVSSLHILFPTRRARHFFIDAFRIWPNVRCGSPVG